MKNRKALIGLALAMLSLALLQSLSMRGLYADGSSYLVSILESETFCDWDASRQFAQIIQQAPLVLGIKSGLENIPVLAGLLSVGVFLIPSLFWLMALIRLRGEAFFWPLFIAYLLVYMNLSVMAMGEYIITYSLVGYSFAVLISRKKITPISGAFLLLVSIALVRSYQSLVFLGPLLFLAGAMRLQEETKKKGHSKNLWIYASLLFYVYATANSLRWILFPQSPQNLDHAINGITHLFQQKQLWATALVGFLYMLVLFARINKPIRLIFTGLSILVSTSLFCPLMWTPPNEHYSARVNAGLLMFALLCAVLFLRYVRPQKTGIEASNIQKSTHMVWFIPVLLFFALSIIDVVHSYRFTQYVSDFRNYVNSNTGFHAVEDTDFDTETYGWAWTQPCMSLLLRSDDSKAIILNSKDYKGWEPFDALTSLPDLSKYYETKDPVQ